MIIKYLVLYIIILIYKKIYIWLKPEENVNFQPNPKILAMKAKMQLLMHGKNIFLVFKDYIIKVAIHQ